MTINKTVQALAGARAIQRACNAIAGALDDLVAINETIVAGGIDLTQYETEIGNDPALQHCDGATYGYLVSDAIPLGLLPALKAYYSGTPTQQAFAALMKARTL